MGSSCSRVASANDSISSVPRVSVSPSAVRPRIVPRTPAIRTLEGRSTPPPLLDLCVQWVARNLGTPLLPPPVRLPEEVTARVVAYLVSRAWLNLAGLKCLRNSPMLVLEVPGLAQVDLTWTAEISTHTELVRLDLSGAPSLTDAAVAPIGKLPALRELNLSNCTALGETSLAHLSTVSTLRMLKLEGLPKVGDAGAAHLERLHGLRWLSLAGCTKIKSAGALSLSRCVSSPSHTTTGCHHMPSHATRCHHMPPHATACHQMPSHASACHHMPPHTPTHTCVCCVNAICVRAAIGEYGEYGEHAAHDL